MTVGKAIVRLHLLAGILATFLAALPAIGQQQASTTSETPVRITLQEALDRARQIDVAYQAALSNAAVSHQDKKQALDALLPGVAYNNSAIYTQGTGLDDNVRFIANNAVHEYI